VDILDVHKIFNFNGENMTEENDNPITIEPAPDIGSNKYRAHCGICSRTFIVNFPQNTLVVCPSCAAIKYPEWADKQTAEEQR